MSTQLKAILPSSDLEIMSDEDYQNKQIPLKLLMDTTNLFMKQLKKKTMECEKLYSKIDELEKEKKESDLIAVERIRTISKLKQILLKNQQQKLEYEREMLNTKMIGLNEDLMNKELVLSKGIDLAQSNQIDKDKQENYHLNDEINQFKKYLRCLQNDDFHGCLTLVKAMKISHKIKCNLIMPMVTKKREEMDAYPWSAMNRIQQIPWDRFRIYRNIICHHGAIYRVSIDKILHSYYAWRAAMGFIN